MRAKILFLSSTSTLILILIRRKEASHRRSFQTYYFAYESVVNRNRSHRSIYSFNVTRTGFFKYKCKKVLIASTLCNICTNYYYIIISCGIIYVFNMSSTVSRCCNIILWESIYIAKDISIIKSLRVILKPSNTITAKLFQLILQ